MTKIDRRVLLKGAGAAALATGLGAPALAQSGLGRESQIAANRKLGTGIPSVKKAPIPDLIMFFAPHPVRAGCV